MSYRKGFEDTVIKAQTISLPKGGGSIKGIGETFQPDSFSGTGSYSIPIPVSTARGFEPRLSVDYSSGGGNGIFGLGFSLSIPKISIRTEKGIPKYDGKDIFIAGAGELVLKLKNPSKKNGFDVYEYLPRIEGSFSTIKHFVKEDKSESYWEITTSENQKSVFGKSWQSRVYNPDDNSQIFEWLVEEEADSKGNRILYSYKSENRDNLLNEVWEEGHSYNNKYIQNIKYGNYFDEKNTLKFAFEVIFDYGEYDISDLDKGKKDPYSVVKKWDYRPDPFSFCKSGFEIRTCRICKNILLFNNFEKELGAPSLVKTVSFDYENPEKYGAIKTCGPSIVKSVTLSGFRREGKNATDSYELQSMPPLTFGFSKFAPPQNPEFEKLEIGKNTIPGQLDSSGFLPVDLKGEGIPGFLYSGYNSLFYLEPEGGGKYSAPNPPETFPIDRSFQKGTASLVDLEGNGELELVVKNGSRHGFYQRNSDDSWDNFRPFESYPADFANSDMEMAGLSGNGKTDLLLNEINDLVVYPSGGKKGYSRSERVLKQHDFPSIKKGYKKEHVTFANIFGDGLSHRVKITDGMVECWPDFGYGKFGKK